MQPARLLRSTEESDFGSVRLLSNKLTFQYESLSGVNRHCNWLVFRKQHYLRQLFVKQAYFAVDDKFGDCANRTVDRTNEHLNLANSVRLAFAIIKFFGRLGLNDNGILLACRFDW